MELCGAVLLLRCSALHFAAGLGNVDCAKLLIEAGADLNVQDREGAHAQPRSTPRTAHTGGRHLWSGRCRASACMLAFVPGPEGR